MNIDCSQNGRRIFLRVTFLILMQNYCITSKKTISLKIFAFSEFVKTVARKIKCICKDLFTLPFSDNLIRRFLQVF